jgi:glycosyltransferase involved in cell wall biosynthesis
MRILVCSQHFWPENFPINSLVDGLVSAGNQVDVITGKPNYPTGKIFSGYQAWGFRHEVNRGVRIGRVPIIPRGKGTAFRLAVNYLSYIFSGLLFAPFLARGRKYDAIMVYASSPLLQALPAVLMKWIKGAPLAVWVLDLWPDTLAATGYIRNRMILGIVGWVVRFIYWQADLVLVPSEAFFDPVSKFSRREKIRYFPQAAERVSSSNNSHRPSPVAGVAAGFSVVFAGNIGTAQAVDTIVDAAELLRDEPSVRLYLVGDGTRRQWVISEVQRRGLTNLLVPGRFPMEDMPPLFADASALLVSLRDESIWAATIPWKIQAYLAAGKPIIASLNGEGARVVASAGAGIHCAAGDARALAAAVVQLANTASEERAAMGLRGRKYYEIHFEPGKLVQRLLAMLQAVQKPGCRPNPENVA